MCLGLQAAGLETPFYWGGTGRSHKSRPDATALIRTHGTKLLGGKGGVLI